jgi:hypothetical protein
MGVVTVSRCRSDPLPDMPRGVGVEMKALEEESPALGERAHTSSLPSPQWQRAPRRNRPPANRFEPTKVLATFNSRLVPQPRRLRFDPDLTYLKMGKGVAACKDPSGAGIRTGVDVIPPQPTSSSGGE